MDSDGEDRAEDILKLIKLAEESDKSIFASRAKEDEFFFTFFIKFIYYFYLSTGENLNFGNLNCIQKIIKSIINLEGSVHYSAAILKSNLKYIRSDVIEEKGTKSKMSLNKLALHGLNAMAIFVEEVLIRFFILSIIGMTFSL